MPYAWQGNQQKVPLNSNLQLLLLFADKLVDDLGVFGIFVHVLDLIEQPWQHMTHDRTLPDVELCFMRVHEFKAQHPQPLFRGSKTSNKHILRFMQEKIPKP